MFKNCLSPLYGIRKIYYFFILIVLLDLTLLYAETDKKNDLEEINPKLYKKIVDDVRSTVKTEVEEEFKKYFLKHQKNIKDDKSNQASDGLIDPKVKSTIKKVTEKEVSQILSTIKENSQIPHKDFKKESSIKETAESTQENLQPSLAQNDKIKNSQLKNTSEGEHPQSIERVLKQRGSMLLRKGSFIFEPSFTYSHFSNNRINVDGLLLLDAFAVGEISTESIQRDIFVQTLAIKHGLLNNLQIETRIPVREEHDRFTKTSGSESTESSSGLGDIDFSMSRQIGWEDGWMPDLVVNIGAKSPSGLDPYNRSIGTGTGHWTIRTTLIAAKSSDPVVVFGSIGYAFNMQREDIENLGDIDPGNSISYSFGSAIALSYKTAINFSFSHSLTMQTERNGEPIAGTFLNVATFKMGLNWSINERLSADFGVNIGITESAPDLTLEIRFPYCF